LLPGAWLDHDQGSKAVRRAVAYPSLSAIRGGMGDRNQFQAFLRARVIGAIHSARAASSLTHQGVKGTVLEILVRELFRPLLPSDIGVGTGQILECASGRLSPQVDVILYDKSILPPILFDEANGVFPIEAVLYAIEVKTTLTRRDIQTAHENAKRLHSFSYMQGRSLDGKSPLPPLQRARNVIFALRSDLTQNDKHEAERYKEIYGDGEIYVVAICVAGQEYWYRQKTAWINFRTVDEFDDVLSFIAGVTNTYRLVAQSRGYPPLGNYIAPSNAERLTIFPAGTSVTVNVSPDGGIQIADAPLLGGSESVVRLGSS
jgi:hypothetical protein